MINILFSCSVIIFCMISLSQQIEEKKNTHSSMENPPKIWMNETLKLNER